MEEIRKKIANDIYDYNGDGNDNIIAISTHTNNNINENKTTDKFDEKTSFKLNIPEEFFIMGYLTPDLQGKYGHIIGSQNNNDDNVSFRLSSKLRNDAQNLVVDIPRFCIDFTKSNKF